MGSPGLSSRIKQSQILRRKLGLRLEHLAALIEPAMDPDILEQIFEVKDSIYRNEKTAVAIEKALQKVALERNIILDGIKTYK